MSSTSIDARGLVDDLVELLNLPSPTGYCQPAITWSRDKLASFGLEAKETPKGGLLAKIAGAEPQPARALTAHVDTLGAMVRQLKPNGRLAVRPLGSVIWSSLETEGCTVFRRQGEPLRGSLLIDRASIHVHGEQAIKRERKTEHMEVRLDARTESADETASLGVAVGDFIAFDPRPEVSQDGFIRARFLDDKAGVVCLLAAVHALMDSGEQPASDCWIHLSNYEEVGHGAAADLPAAIKELVAVDMAAVGEGQNSTEFAVTVCKMDSGGPYHYGLSEQLLALAKAQDIAHNLDLYPYYRSDGSAHWFAGGAARVALVGPGIDASHNYERTHQDALLASSQLLLAYLSSAS